MRSLTTKLLAAIAPTLAALAILCGSASAVQPASRGHCPLDGQMVPGVAQDHNSDGMVCERINPAGKLITQDDRQR
jgi:hypothetical protein